MRRVLDWLYDAAGYLAAFFVFAIFAVMICSTVMRELSISTGGIEDLVAWLCAAAAFLAMPHAFKHGDFVRMELLISHLNPARRRIAETGALLLGTAFCAYLTFWAVRMTWGSYEYGVMSDGLLCCRSGFHSCRLWPAPCCCLWRWQTRWCACCAASARPT